MFIAIDEQQKMVNSLSMDEEILRKKSRNKEIFCPDCRHNVRFRSGTFRAHFYHEKNGCTNPFAEPESETHLKGKVLLYGWLKSLYPSANVQLEWKVDETNQRSDVMVLHNNGERWAFEFQCTPISEEVWKERHDLYAQAGITDFWILSSHISRFFTEGNTSLRLTRDLEKGIFKNQKRIYYLNVENEQFHVIRGGELYSKTMLSDTDTFILPVVETTLTGLEIWHKKMLSYYADDKHIYKLEDNQILFDITWEELDKIHQKRQEQAREKQNEYFRLLINTRNSEWGYLSEKEKIIVKELFIKHHYSLENLPGFFFCEAPAQYEVETPSFLIQLWLYDQLIYQKSKTPSKKHNFPVLYAPNALTALNLLKRRGGYRVKKTKDSPIWLDPDKSLVDDILEFWCSVGLLMPMGEKARWLFRIASDYLPPHSSLTESIFTEWYYGPKSKDIPIPSEVVEANRTYKESLKLQY